MHNKLIFVRCNFECPNMFSLQFERFFMRVSILFLMIALCGMHMAFSQSSLTFLDPDLSFRQGIELLNKGKYLAASQSFHEYMVEGKDALKMADAQYYRAFCAIQLRNDDGEFLIEQFIKEQPQHAKSTLAYFELANLKYSEKNYKLAIKYYEKCQMNSLSEAMQHEAKFKLGYAYFTQKRFDEAYELFNELKRVNNKFQYPSSYYAGYLNFNEGEYDRAFYDLTRAEKNEAYAPVIPAMLVKVYYKQGRYDELIRYGKQTLSAGNVKDRPALNLYIGEAYFEKDDYVRASNYYKLYLADAKGNTDRNVLFRIGYVQMTLEDENQAIHSFKKVAIVDDTLGYIASFYLGNLYVKQGNKNYALAAYKVCKDHSFDAVLEEESLFQYARVCLDIGNFDEAVKSIQEYKSRYPGSSRTQNIDEILTEAYLNSKNYDLAISHIEGMKYRSGRINRAYQQITFFKGTELFNDKKFYAAIQMFDKSLQHPLSNSFVVKAQYWRGEAFSIGLKYQEAKNAYDAVMKSDIDASSTEYLPARYGLAYSCFNLKQYGEALDHFRFYLDGINNPKHPTYLDALVRLGDCYYATKQYQAALEVFDRVIGIDREKADYCYFRKGVVYGIMGNLKSANVNFDKVIAEYPDSRHLPNTLYQKAQFNFENGAYTYAIDVFSTLIQNYATSNYIPFALQSRAIASSNLNRFQDAERDYKLILDTYPTHEIANSALLGLQEVMLKTGSMDEFQTYLTKYKQANPDSDQLESIEFEAAKSQYFNQNYAQAIDGFDRFLATYPGSAFSTEAIYLKADSYMRTEQIQQALEHYYLIVADLGFARHNRVVQRIAEIELANKNYDKSIEQLKDLERISASRKEQFTAWSGLMNAYYATGAYAQAINYGKLILDEGTVMISAKNEALLLIAKSHLALNEKEQARGYLEQAVENGTDAYGAEALFLIAELLNTEAQYQASIDRLFQLNNKYSMYELWLGKSFILIADNYLALGEDFQAKATYQSVIDNSPLQEVVDEAELKLMVLQEEIQKQSEITQDTLEIEEIENR
jgi:tetratricopeptide (TPR) repeat protein